MTRLLLGALLLVCAAPVRPQGVTIDQNVIDDIFGRPNTTDSPAFPTPSVTRSPPVTPVPTPEPVPVPDITNKDKEDQPCKCVPYYLCDADLNAVNVNNATINGWGILDVRFGESECTTSVERCCKNPKQPNTVTEAPLPEKNNLPGCGHSNPNGLDVTLVTDTNTEAQFGEFPWVVALLDHLNNSYAGVGVLIHPQVVMTGAHIATKYAPGTLRARAGEWDTQTNKERLPNQERVVTEMQIHEEFRRKTLYNDVALLRLESPVQLAQHINVICLPEQDEQFDNSRGCVVNGWGKDVFGQEGKYAVFLKKVVQDMIPHARCNMLLQNTRLGRRFNLHGSFVCAGGKEGEDACEGDGGAPLACPIGGDRYKLTGLVAWGIGCGMKDVPAVYASVSVFRKWIDNKMTAWGFDTSGYAV